MATKRKRSPAVHILNTSKPSPNLQKDLSICVGKICAYRRVKKEVEAQNWATTLVTILEVNGLYS